MGSKPASAKKVKLYPRCQKCGDSGPILAMVLKMGPKLNMKDTTLMCEKCATKEGK